MKWKSKSGVAVSFLITVTMVVGFSLLVTLLFGGLSEKKEAAPEIIVQSEMTAAEIAKTNLLEESLVKSALKIQNNADMTKKISALGIDSAEASREITIALNYAAEEASKNPLLIISKFVLWAVFLTAAFMLLRKNKMTPKLRRIILLAAFVFTGVILGSEPNSMSTLKDMVTAYAIKGIVFMPRLVALLIFLLVVLAANKFICAWACQFGTLQDFIFRLNRDQEDRKGIIRQYKIPFWLSNGVRLTFFAIFLVAAFAWSVDIIEMINPFNIYKPAVLSAAAIIFISILLTASLFIYRPWCHLFCPFGLLGWVVEKFSWYKIKVNYDTCIACERCAVSCPSTVMGAILKRQQTIPDCFACGTCINVCPTKSITFDKGKRTLPPDGKFKT